MKVCIRCHIEKDEKYFRRGSKNCRLCLREKKRNRVNGGGQAPYERRLLIKKHEEEEEQESRFREQRKAKERVFDRMRKQNTVYCFHCEVEIPCEEIETEWAIYLQGGELHEKCNRLYGTCDSGYHKRVPGCWCCCQMFKRRDMEREMRAKKRELQVKASTYMGLGVAAIEKFPHLVNLKVNELFYKKQFKNLKQKQ